HSLSALPEPLAGRRAEPGPDEGEDQQDPRLRLSDATWSPSQRVPDPGVQGVPVSIAAGFYVTGGTGPPGTPSYVDRQADRDLLEGLSRGEFCYVLTSRQRGKSSLMAHAPPRLREAGITVVNLDLTRLGQNLSVEQWYDGLLGHLGRQLDLEDELEEYWAAHERHAPLQ